MALTECLFADWIMLSKSMSAVVWASDSLNIFTASSSSSWLGIFLIIYGKRGGGQHQLFVLITTAIAGRARDRSHYYYEENLTISITSTDTLCFDEFPPGRSGSPLVA